jgi:hypothetical protein
MAINLTTINGTDSIAATRITINDNFATLSSAVNSFLSIIDIATGFIDNSGFGSNNNIKTGNLNVTGNTGIEVTTGSINIQIGNLILNNINSRIEFGSGSGVSIKRVQRGRTSGNIFILDISGATGPTAPGAIGYQVVPRQTTATIKDIRDPELGALVYDTALNVLAYCVGTATVSGGTGTWVKISSTGATSL